MAYTEFYCQNGGSNLNAGTTNNNTPVYSSIHGNWTNATGVFTPTDGTTPASTVSAGMRASVYIDGATVGVYVGEISAVAAGVNGAITANTRPIGSKPANQTGTATIVVGGAWQGPNAASGFPFTLTNYGNNQDSSSHLVCTNLKNDQTYSLTAAFTPNNSGARSVISGYTSSVRDGGKATFDGGTSTSSLISAVGAPGTQWVDLIFTSSISSGTGTLFTAGTQVGLWLRCVFSGSRGVGLQCNASSTGASVVECEAYNNNRNNTSGLAGFSTSGIAQFLRCVSHDNTGSNTSGFLASAGNTSFVNCIADTNGQYGFSNTSTSVNGVISIQNCDIYNNGSDGINIASGNVNFTWIENTNLIKNTGAGINNASTTASGYVYNCGYGSGTQANGSADTINNLTQTGSVTYGSNLTPWVDPANGDFRINLPAANFAGRAAFTETAASYAGTAGYPDIGAAQSLTGGGGTFSKEVSYGFA